MKSFLILSKKHSGLHRLVQKVKRNLFSIFQAILIVLLFILLAASLGVMFSENVNQYISGLVGLSAKNRILTFLGFGMGGILVALQALMSYKRAKAMEDAAKAQAMATDEQAKANKHTEQGQRQERMKNAIEHLGNQSGSVRLGGTYELFHLAKDIEELRQTVLDILCAHIRRMTGENRYQETYKSKPSEEVQSLLNLLFVQEFKVFKGLHTNLQGSWLNGAALIEAHLEQANLADAHLQEASIQEAYLQGARLQEAHLQKAVLQSAHLQNAVLQNAHLQGARVQEAYLQGAFLDQAHLQGAELNGAHLQGAFLDQAHLQGAELNGVHLQGANLQEANLQGVNLPLAHLQGTKLNGARLQGAELYKAHLQGAELYKADLRGAKSGNRDRRISFEDRIRDSIGNDTDFTGVIFKGGLSRKEVDVSVTGLLDKNAERLRIKLKTHIGEPESNQLPYDSRATIGTYSEKEAEEWIAEYEQAMSEVPGDASLCRL